MTDILHDKVILGDGNMLIFDGTAEELNEKVIAQFINYHQENLANHYQKLLDVYLAKHDILSADEKEAWKPDNRVVINFPKKAVNTFSGFFLGNPIKIDSKNETVDTFVSNFNRYSYFNDKIKQISDGVDIYGLDHALVYQNEEANTDFNEADPRTTFVIHNATFEHLPLAAVTYRQLADSPIDKRIAGTVYFEKTQYDFTTSAGFGIDSSIDKGEEEKNVYELIPIIEFYSNKYRKGLFEDELSIIDQIDKAMSSKANDVEYYSSSILAILNADVPVEEREQALTAHLLWLNGDQEKSVDAKFLEKPAGDVLQENLLDRLVDYFYQVSGIPNLSDETFGNASGTSLEFKLLPMENMASSKRAKFEASLRAFYEIVFSADKGESIGDREWRDLEFTFKFKIPHNIQDEAQTAMNLKNSGLVSDETAMKVLSVVDDPEEEVKKRDEEVQVLDDNAAE